MQMDSTLQILDTLITHQRIQLAPNSTIEDPVYQSEAVIVSLVDFSLSRLESFEAANLIASAVTVKQILSTSINLLNSNKFHENSQNLPFLKQRDYSDRKDALKRRIAQIASFVYGGIVSVPGWEGTRPVFAPKYECSAALDIESFVKEVVATARATWASVKTDSEDVRMDVGEQVVTFMDAEFSRLSLNDPDHHESVHKSCPSCFEALKARTSDQVWLYFSECCIEMQTKVLDTIEDPSLRDRRRAANKNVDAFLARIESQRENADLFMRDLEQLSEFE
ncbi:hypothetical protein HDU79_001181 [Rhizoclosmatium sp. JEL0117]|nr:hypothetical protein HDU79_001181 [Rhizoclosmatium sp. JEL0117]